MSAHVLEALPAAGIDTVRRCRLCGGAVAHSLVDLGMSPLCESFLAPEQLDAMEPYFPLHALVCGSCFLVQLNEYVSPEHIFREYAYFSSYSTTWVAHAQAYCAMITRRLGLGPDSLVVELASNDGYLLQHFLPLGVPVLGIEPAANVRQGRDRQGHSDPRRVLRRRAGRGSCVAEGRQADLIVGNNVLAQVPDLNDFVAGMARLLKPEGVITLEFPHLERLIAENQFDTIYHEHFSYFSLIAIERLAGAPRAQADRRRGARRPMAARCASISRTPAPRGATAGSVAELLAREQRLGPARPRDLRRRSPSRCGAPSASCSRS